MMKSCLLHNLLNFIRWWYPDWIQRRSFWEVKEKQNVYKKVSLHVYGIFHVYRKGYSFNLMDRVAGFFTFSNEKWEMKWKKKNPLITMRSLKSSSQLIGMVQSYMDTSAPPIFALELAEAIVHIQVKWVYAGPWAPSPGSTERTLSHLSTCEILHTSHNWSMTVSANCIRCFSTCFLHKLYGLLS